MFLLCDNNDLIDGENEPSNASKCLQCLSHSDEVYVCQPITNLQSYFATHFLPSFFLTFCLFNVSLCHCCLLCSLPCGGSPVAASTFAAIFCPPFTRTARFAVYVPWLFYYWFELPVWCWQELLLVVNRVHVIDQHNVHKSLTEVQQLHRNSLTNDFILTLLCDLKG